MTVECVQYSKEHAGLALGFKVNPDSCGRHSHYEEYLRYCALSVPFYEKMGFSILANHYEVPREMWNKDCTPMILRLPEIE